MPTRLKRQNSGEALLSGAMQDNTIPGQHEMRLKSENRSLLDC